MGLTMVGVSEANPADTEPLMTAAPLHPALVPEYDAAIARGLSEKSARREAFVLNYRITDNAGAYRSREEVIKTVAAYLRSVVKRPGPVARRFVDDHDFMRRRAGETAGSIARDVWDACPADEWKWTGK